MSSSDVALSFLEINQPYVRAAAGEAPQNGPMLPHNCTNSFRTASVLFMRAEYYDSNIEVSITIESVCRDWPLSPAERTDRSGYAVSILVMLPHPCERLKVILIGSELNISVDYKPRNSSMDMDISRNASGEMDSPLRRRVMATKSCLPILVRSCTGRFLHLTRFGSQFQDTWRIVRKASSSGSQFAHCDTGITDYFLADRASR